MIIIPEKVVYIKVPKAASTTIARLFWNAYGINEDGQLSPKVATNIRHFMPLSTVGPKIPVLNGNWFFNRSGAFGWHTSYDDLAYLFGDQLSDYHWIASVRHPVARLFSAFTFQVAKERLAAAVCTAHFEEFCRLVFSNSPHLTQQQRLHTWPQSMWLPSASVPVRFSIIRQESLAEDLKRMSRDVPTFGSARLSHIGKSFEGKWRDYVSPDLQRKIEEYYAEDMMRFGYRSISIGQECGVAK